MSFQNETLLPTVEDKEAPLPYIRRYPDFKPEEVKFEYEYEKESTKVTTKKYRKENTEVVETYTEVTTEVRSKKVTLKCYGHTWEEDPIVFFQCYTKMLKDLESVVRKASASKASDANTLFRAMDKMLIGTANANWQTTLQELAKEPTYLDVRRNLKQNWEVYKNAVASYICGQVFSQPGIYDLQVKYLQNRHKPKGFTAMEWHRRFQEYNSYLCYLFPSLEAMKRQFEGADFTMWMTAKAGSLTEAQERRIIVENVKSSWKNALRCNDMSREFRESKPARALIDYYTTLEALEQNNGHGREQGRRLPNNRNDRQISANRARSGFRRNQQYRQQDRRSPGNYNNRNNYRNRQQGRGYGYNNNRNNQHRNYNQAHNQGGNRDGRNTSGNNTSNQRQGSNNNDRSGGQRDGRNNFQQSSQGRGRFQGQNFNSRYQRPSNAYYQEDASGDAQEQLSDNEQAVNEENEANLTEAQWMERWNDQFNESLYLDANYSSEEEQEEIEEHFAIEEDDDDGDYAAFTGSNYV